MKVLSIDIGIKNLAYVIINHEKDSKNYTITNWDIINLCNKIPNCSTTNCKSCAKFSKKNLFFCKKHTKNDTYKIPSINIKTLSKQSIKSIKKIAQDNSIDLENNTNKSEIIKIIEDYVDNYCFDVIENINANNVNLIDLGINLKQELNKLFDSINLESLDMILLENQISPIANRMKTLQGMVTQYFIDYGNNNIEFMSAANKLKLFCESKKTSYNERKKMSIEYTYKLLNNKELDMNDMVVFFSNNKKKDDLADCFLQCIYYLNKFNNLII
jgi:hypothetical protein